MTPGADDKDLDFLLRTMDGRMRAWEAVSQRSLSHITEARDQLKLFRWKPLGGRLIGLKRFVYWFSASAFERQTKIQDAIIDALDEIACELVDVRNRMAVLRTELEQRGASASDRGADSNGA